MIDMATATPQYQYYLKDHLGNTRVVVNSDNTAQQITNYYAFGLTSQSYQSGTSNKYLYNGKELQDDLIAGRTLDWLDYGWRMYDSQLGRWHCIDPANELVHNWTPYRYGFNNPILFNDAFGLWEKTANGWTTNDSKDIERFMSMMQIEESQHGSASMAQVDMFISEEFNGSGGKLSNGSVLLSEVTATKNNNDNWELTDYSKNQMTREIGNYGSYYQNHNNFVSRFSFYSYKYFRERSWHANGGGFPGVSLASFGLDAAEYKMLNKYTWFSLKQMKTYSTKFNGSGYTGGKLKHAGKWANRIGVLGAVTGIYGAYGTIQEYEQGKLSNFGAIYIGGTDGAGIIGGIYGGAYSFGTGIGKWIVESDWYFNAVHKDSRVW